MDLVLDAGQRVKHRSTPWCLSQDSLQKSYLSSNTCVQKGDEIGCRLHGLAIVT